MFLFKSTSGVQDVSVNDAYREMAAEGNILVDVREDFEYKNSHAKGAVNMPLSQMSDVQVKLLQGKNKVFLICQSGGRSQRATQLLASSGVQAINVVGGTSAWISSGLPIE